MRTLRFALGAVVVDSGGQLALGLADLVGEARALGDQALDVTVDLVDLRAHIGQRQRCQVGAGFEAALALPFALLARCPGRFGFFGAFLLDLLLAIGIPCCGTRTRRCAPFIAQP